jgi:hypothetical protein
MFAQSLQENLPQLRECKLMNSRRLIHKNRPCVGKYDCVASYTKPVCSVVKLRAMNGNKRKFSNGLAPHPTGWRKKTGSEMTAPRFWDLRSRTFRQPRPSMPAKIGACHGGGSFMRTGQTFGRRRIGPAWREQSCAIIAQGRRFFLPEFRHEVVKPGCAGPIRSKAWAKIMSLGQKAISPN